MWKDVWAGDMDTNLERPGSDLGKWLAVTLRCLVVRVERIFVSKADD